MFGGSPQSHEDIRSGKKRPLSSDEGVLQQRQPHRHPTLVISHEEYVSDGPQQHKRLKATKEPDSPGAVSINSFVIPWWKQKQHPNAAAARENSSMTQMSTCFICQRTVSKEEEEEAIGRRHDEKIPSKTLLNYFSTTRSVSSSLTATTPTTTTTRMDPSQKSVCTNCERSACSDCTRQCESCNQQFCSMCSVTDYSQRADRIFCFDCHRHSSFVEESSVDNAMHID